MEATLIFWFDLRVKMKLPRGMGPLYSLQAISHKYYLPKSSFDKSWIATFKVVTIGKNLVSEYF